MILSNIVIYDKNISAEYYTNKTIETKEKWNQINVLSMDSMLGGNCRMPLIHMSKRYLWIEETSQSINEFLLDLRLIQIYTQTIFLKSK